jgi:hypothetical protein
MIWVSLADLVRRSPAVFAAQRDGLDEFGEFSR